MSTLPTEASAIDIHAKPARLQGLPRVASQTWALTVDAYRQLQARKLFWVTLGLSTLVAASFAIVGINEMGIRFLWFDTLETPLFSTATISRDQFYKMLFITLGINVWLAWAAIILALISTAGMLPELVSDGSIDLYLSKPLGRVRLLLTKYFLGLLFVALQTACFTMAAFLVIGMRGNVWLPSLFLAIPIVTLFYSFLFCMTALIGLLTGSTVAAILLTLLAWLLLFSINQVDIWMLQMRAGQEITIEQAQGTIDFNRQQLERLRGSEVERPVNQTRLQTFQGGLDLAQEHLNEAQSSLERWERAHRWVLAIKAPLPKTGETIGALQRVLLPPEDMEAFAQQQGETFTQHIPNEEARQRQRSELDAGARASADFISRPLWWSIGTSIGFQAALLGLAAWHFVRRDF